MQPGHLGIGAMPAVAEDGQCHRHESIQSKNKSFKVVRKAGLPMSGGCGSRSTDGTERCIQECLARRFAQHGWQVMAVGDAKHLLSILRSSPSSLCLSLLPLSACLVPAVLEECGHINAVSKFSTKVTG